MSSVRTINAFAQNFPNAATDAVETHTTQEKSQISVFFEDGWVFRERPGKRIECVGRYDDAVMAGFRALHAESLKSAAD
jgi:hypothetical protein